MFTVVKPEARHRAFIEDTFCRSVTEAWPWAMMPWANLRDDFRRRTKGPWARVGVAVLKEDPDCYLGWAAVAPMENEIVYAYTTGAYRTRPGVEFRVASTLATHLGADLTKTTRLRYWTPAAEEISTRQGWKLEPAR